MIVCLGATAAQDLMGKDFKITKERGKVIKDTAYAPWLMATYHPSAILRMPDADAREQAMRDFVSDIRKVKQRIDVDKGRN